MNEITYIPRLKYSLSLTPNVGFERTLVPLMRVFSAIEAVSEYDRSYEFKLKLRERGGIHWSTSSSVMHHT